MKKKCIFLPFCCRSHTKSQRCSASAVDHPSAAVCVVPCVVHFSDSRDDFFIGYLITIFDFVLCALNGNYRNAGGR